VSGSATGTVETPPFRERFPWHGGDLQTLRNFIRRRLGWRPRELCGERVMLSLADGGGLAARLTLGRTGHPMAVLIHGLTGCETATNMIVAARHLGEAGYPTLRLNLRGTEPSRATTAGHYHAGRSADLADALASLAPRIPAAGLVLLGFSLGANMMIKFLAEHGRDFPIRAAAAVSTPIDLRHSIQTLQSRRNRLYHRFLLDRIKAEWNAVDLTPEYRRKLAAVATIEAFDDALQAPLNGFEGADDYYEKCMALRFLERVPVPTLLIHARNDPWISAAPYDAVDWTRHPQLRLLLPARGGHVGFHGRGDNVPWHCRAVSGFYDAREG